MPIELKVPSFGESVTEAYLGEWLKAVGDTVKLDDPVVVLETDKVTAELPAPAAGTITELLKSTGDTAEVGEVIGYMEEGAVEDTEVPAKAAAPAEAATSATASAASPPGSTTHVMPAASRVLAERGIDASQVTPSGPGGRLLKEDALNASPAPSPTGSPAAAPTPPPVPTAVGGSREDERVPMSRLRQRIAERLVHAQQTAALLTTFNEVDMSNVIALRKEHKEAFIERYGVKLGFMSFFVKAAVDALTQFPQVNSWIDGTDVIYHNYVDVGIAVGGGRGLVVPVIRNAERLGFAAIESQIGDFARRAQANELELSELQGGTFTISNGGVYGSLMSTPIVNPPQTAILGLHAIQERPVVRDGEIVVRPMMNIAMTYDHRIIDGRESVTFLRRIKDCVENPSRILLEI